MTGGQPVDGTLTVPDIAHQVRSEGVKTIVVLSDDPDKWSKHELFPEGTEFMHRDELDAIQKRLRDTPGCTVLIYDQTCAAEKRRRRKRKLMVDPPKRAFINSLVCEGCGDCSVKSNCVSVMPLETEYGQAYQRFIAGAEYFGERVIARANVFAPFDDTMLLSFVLFTLIAMIFTPGLPS